MGVHMNDYGRFGRIALCSVHNVRDHDYVLCGGGLASGLLALELAARQPDARVLLIERQAVLGDGHTWSFHARDVSPAVAARLAPAVAATLPATAFSFPGMGR